MFQTTRQKTIEAQCFAYLVLDSYLTVNGQSTEDASRTINLNSELIKREDPDMSTRMTREEVGLREGQPNDG